VGLLDRILGRPELTGDEEKVVALVRSGKKRQKDVLAASGMNPVKFNRVMRSLEEKGVARRVPRGRENTVELL